MANELAEQALAALCDAGDRKITERALIERLCPLFEAPGGIDPNTDLFDWHSPFSYCANNGLIEAAVVCGQYGGRWQAEQEVDTGLVTESLSEWLAKAAPARRENGELTRILAEFCEYLGEAKQVMRESTWFVSMVTQAGSEGHNPRALAALDIDVATRNAMEMALPEGNDRLALACLDAGVDGDGMYLRPDFRSQVPLVVAAAENDMPALFERLVTEAPERFVANEARLLALECSDRMTAHIHALSRSRRAGAASGLVQARHVTKPRNAL